MTESNFIKLIVRYIESDNEIDLDIFILLVSSINIFEFRKNVVLKYLINKVINIDDIKKIIAFMNYDKEIVSDFYHIVYESYKDFKLKSNNEKIELAIEILEWLIDVGYEPNKYDDFYYYYVEKKNEILFDTI